MKLAYNPITEAALSNAPNSNDIIFDLKGLNIFAKGVKFRGTDTTYSVFKKNTSSSGGGYNGLVPVPSYTTSNSRYLREDGTWQVPSNQYTYSQLYNADLDNLKTEGKWYFISGGSNNTNGPTNFNNGAELYVGRNASGYRYQKVITFDGKIWVRIFNSSSWGSWTRWYTDANTDNKVLQSITTTSNYRPLILGAQNSTDISSLANSTTSQVYATTKLYAQPSTGYLWATKLYSGGKEVITSHQSLSNYVTLTTNQTITGIKTFSTQQKFTVANGTAPFTVTSSTLVTNLNADKLDGVHLNEIFTGFSANGNATRLVIGGVTKDLTIPYASNADMLDSHHATYFVNYIGGTTPSWDSTYEGYILHFDSAQKQGDNPYDLIHGNQATVIQVLPNSKTQYGAQLAIGFSSNALAYRNRKGNSEDTYGWNSWQYIAAGSLVTPRKINGTSFNGTSDITTSYWGTSRNVYIQDSTAAHTGAAVSVNGSSNIYLKLPATITGTLSGNASSATMLTSSAGSASLPVYFSEGKPVACTASSLFSNLSNSGNNISITIAGQNRTLQVGYSNNSDKLDGYHYTSFPLRIGGNLYTTSTSPTVKLLRFTRTDEKGWLVISITDSNNSSSGVHSKYVISWGYDPTNTDKSISIKCLYSIVANVSSNLIAVRTSGGTFDLYYKATNTASKVGYIVEEYSDACTINSYSASIAASPTATTTSSLTTLYANILGSLTGNASTASKLQTSRTLWGQSFDGSANVSGTMYNVPTIINQNYQHRFEIGRVNFDHWDFYEYGGTFNFYKCQDATGQSKTLLFNISPTYTYVQGNLGVGTTSPSQRLHVSGNVLSSGFMKSGSSDSYVLLGGGGHISLSGLNVSHNHDDRYVNVTGDTMTGTLTTRNRFYTQLSGRTDKVGMFQSSTADRGGIVLQDTDGTEHVLYLTTSNLLWKNRTIWDSGNDGSGSGLDSDMLDGQHASAFSYKSWWHWSGQSGQPSWIWGGNSENNYYVYNPSNFSVNYAKSAGNADTLDNWHLSYILKDGYITSGTAGLASYWIKMWDYTLNSQYNDIDITLYVHSAFNQLWGIIALRLRQNGTGTARNITANLTEIIGNIPSDRFRLYYNNSNGLCQLWGNVSGQYNVFNYRVLAKTWRTATESTAIGTFYTSSITTAQTLPADSYVTITNLSLVNNTATSTKLQTARKINGTSFDGTSDITTSAWGATRTISLTGAVTGSVSTNGSGNITINTTYGTGNITNLDNRYLKKTGDTMNGTLSFHPTYSSDASPKIYSTVSSGLTSLNFEVADDSNDRFVFRINYYNNTNNEDRERFIINWNGVTSKAPITAPSFKGNATSATQLQTSRKINGTSFNGTADIITSYWGSTRTLTIGNTGKSVNGSGNVSWSLSEIGAASSSHTHKYIVSRGTVTAESGTTNPSVSGLSMSQAYNNGYPTSYGNVITLNGAGKGQLLIGWSGTSGATAPVYVRSKRDTGDADWSSWAQFYTTANPQVNITGNAASATKLQTSRTLWGQSFDGTANVTGNMSSVGSINMSGDILISQASTTGTRQIRFTCGDNDYARIAAGATASNAGWLEIATADDANEPIYVRQYSGPYTTLKRTLTLLDGSGNTSLPGYITSVGFKKSGSSDSYVLLGGGGHKALTDFATALSLASYVTLHTPQTIDSTKSFSAQQKFTVAQGTSPFTVTSSTVVTNLNADLLDGVQLVNIMYYSTGNSYDNSAGSRIIPISGVSLTDSAIYGSILQWSNSTTRTPSQTGTNDNWYNQIYGATNDRLYFRTRTNGESWTSWHKIAYITDNVASATKLQTSRTINGTSFNGTANITTSKWGTSRVLSLTGAITGSASIDGGSNVSISTSYDMTSLDSRYVNVYGDTMTGDLGLPPDKATIDGSAVFSGALVGYISPDSLSDNKSVIGSFTDTNQTWYSVISVRHRNGYGDGKDYGMYLRAKLTSTSDLYWRQQYGSWLAERTLIDNVNYTTYIKKIGSSSVGNSGTPIYLDNGVPTACSFQIKGSASQPVVLFSGIIYHYKGGTGNDNWALDYNNSIQRSNMATMQLSITDRGLRVYYANSHIHITSASIHDAKSTISVASYKWITFGAETNKSSTIYIPLYWNGASSDDIENKQVSAWNTYVDSINLTLFGYIS